MAIEERFYSSEGLPPGLTSDQFNNWINTQVGVRGGDPFTKRQGIDQKALEFVYNFERAILYEDEDVLVINKPSGVLTYRVDDIADVHLGAMEIAQHFRGKQIKPAHRIDRETSGILVFTKNERAYQMMRDQISRKLSYPAVEKRYLTIMDGEWHVDEGRVSLHLTRDPQSTRRGLMRVVPPEDIPNTLDAQKALSYFSTVAVLCEPSTGRKYTLAEVQIITGRTHQIRVSALDRGHPVSGDGFYNEHNPKIPRLMLHAHELTFYRPSTNEVVHVTAPIPDDMRHVIKSMQWEY